MKTLLITNITLIWLGLATVCAQNTATSTKAFAAVTPDGKAVQVKWLIFIPRKIQYHILRRNINENKFTRLTTTPLLPAAAVDPKASATVQAGQQKYLKVVQTIPKKNEAKFFLKLFATSVYIDNAFAQAAALGFAYARHVDALGADFAHDSQHLGSADVESDDDVSWLRHVVRTR